MAICSRGLCIATAALVAHGALAGTPQIVLAPDHALFDEPVSIRLVHLAPGQRVSLAQHTDLWADKAWESRAEFVADADGVVDLNQQVPASGSYSYRDGMGLFWNAELKDGTTKGLRVTSAFATHLALSVDGRTVATAQLQRRFTSEGVKVTNALPNGLVGSLLEPPQDGRHPALILLGGSEGAHDNTQAALLASRGYTVLSLAYFGEGGLPPTLVKIPLEYLKSGIDWLRQRASVDPDRIGVIGASKGAELALLLGATYPEIKAVVAKSPTDVVWSGIGKPHHVTSWTLAGKELPWVQCHPSVWEIAELMLGRRIKLRDSYVEEEAYVDEDSAPVEIARAAIPVEKTRGALLLLSGKDDGLWNSAAMGDALMRRLRAHGHPYPDQHLSYEGAGHALPAFYHSALGVEEWAGGNPEADARAFADYYPKLLAFLAKNLAAN